MSENPTEQHGMTKERYYILMETPGAHLTQEEIAAGWYFSDEFDGLLVHKTWPEAQYD